MFTGSFPSSYAALSNLEYLTASRTYLGGELPAFLLRDMHMLVKLVSKNKPSEQFSEQPSEQPSQ
eukprot:402341-Prorocentrum_minimum.AAC.1